MVDTERHEFLRVFLMHQDRIYGFILTLVFDRTDAQDIFQETSLTLWEKWEEFERDRDFVKWACGIAFNHVRNARRRTGRPCLNDEVLKLVADTRLDSEVWLQSRREALLGCLKQLKLEQRQLLERCYTGSQTIRQVAQNYGLTPNVLYKLLGRIRRMLYDCISRSLNEERPTSTTEGGT